MFFWGGGWGWGVLKTALSVQCGGGLCLQYINTLTCFFYILYGLTGKKMLCLPSPLTCHRLYERKLTCYYILKIYHFCNFSDLD